LDKYVHIGKQCPSENSIRIDIDLACFVCPLFSHIIPELSRSRERKRKSNEEQGSKGKRKSQ
jgi:hypothetical protein